MCFLLSLIAVCNQIKLISPLIIYILRIEVPDGSYTLVSADEDEGAGGDVYYVSVDQDPDQSPEVCLTACTDKRKPQFKH
jgi:hypothetical protein